MKGQVCIWLVLMFLLVSCEDENDPNAFDFGIEKEFRMNKQYIANNLSLVFTIIEIADSRCPVGAYCFWSGTVHLKIAIESPVADTIVIFTHEGKIAQSNGFKFEVVDVSPYPEIGSDRYKEDYRIRMKIRE